MRGLFLSFIVFVCVLVEGKILVWELDVLLMEKERGYKCFDEKKKNFLFVWGFMIGIRLCINLFLKKRKC